MPAEESCFLFRSREVADQDTHHVRSTFPVSNNIGGETLADVLQGILELGEIDGLRDMVGRQAHDGIRSGFISVNGQTVECIVDHGTQHRLELLLLHGCIGQNVRQHRGHVWFDHTSALRDSDNSRTVGKRDASNLCESIGRHDGLGSVQNGICLHVLNRLGNDVFGQFFGRQAPSDDTGAGRQDNVGRIEIQGFRDGLAY
mmetsp:Transcript_10047/g.21055  ORF Transcript_10047/g.21055 Transcript_10047/m.21055 type:complete len:201 (-) Transcript_10047:569-1171(-)